MTTTQVWSNIVAYGLQVGVLVGLGALIPVLLRIRVPRARLLYWQMVLVTCLALPWVRNWRQVVVNGTAQLSGAITATAVTSNPPFVRPAMAYGEIALWLLAAGVAVRLGFLAVGLIRLSGYRQRGRELPAPQQMAGVGAWAALLLSDEIAGPVTFGWHQPVVLLPASFPALPDEMREAILCHELLHVMRRDWLFTIAEELVRAALWFHPAIWWVIGEIQLAREQTVDQAVVEMTRARGPYVDALLLMAGTRGPAAAQLDLAPAPMFLRRRHLKRRLIEVVKEVQMTTISKTRLAFAGCMASVMLTAVCWLATSAFPLAAAPQVVADSPGVAVNMNGSQLMHRASVPYPVEALTKGVEGTVVVQVKLDSNGEVTDAAVLSGPDELRKAVLQSVLAWHFDKSEASMTRTVNIDFVKPAGAAAMPPPPPPPSLSQSSGKLNRILITGLSDSARSDLLAKLPVKEGGEWSQQALASVRTVVREFDPHLTVAVGQSAAGDIALRINLAGTGISFTTNSGSGSALAPSSSPVANSLPPGVFSVGNGTTAPVLLLKVDPQYSEEAQAAKYAGTVQLSIVVGTDGKADDIKVVKSIGMGLDEMAIAAVQQWVFRPGVNQGIPVKTRALVEVNFRPL